MVRAGYLTEAPPQTLCSFHIFPLQIPTTTIMLNDGMTTMASAPRARAPARACDRCRRRKAKVRAETAKKGHRSSVNLKYSLTILTLPSATLQTQLQSAAVVAQPIHNARLICRSLDVDPRRNGTSPTARLIRTVYIVPSSLLWRCPGPIPRYKGFVILLGLSSLWSPGNPGFR